MFDPIMKKAWIWLSVVTVIFTTFPALKAGNIPDVNPITALNLFISIAFNGFIVLLIRRIRGNELTSSKPPYVKSEIGVINYVLTGLFIKFLSIFPSLPLFMMIYNGKPSVASSIASIPIMTISATLITWVFFSKDRKGQLKWVFSFIRSY